MGTHEEMRAIDIFLSHSRAHTHWIGQQDLQADIGRVSKKSFSVVDMGSMACLNPWIVYGDGVLTGMISEIDSCSCLVHA